MIAGCIQNFLQPRRTERLLTVGLVKNLTQESPRIALPDRRNLPRSTRSDHTASGFAALRAYVDNVIGNLHHIQIVLDHDGRIAAVHQFGYHIQKLLYILEMKSRRRLVQDIQRAASSDDSLMR